MKRIIKRKVSNRKEKATRRSKNERKFEINYNSSMEKMNKTFILYNLFNSPNKYWVIIIFYQIINILKWNQVIYKILMYIIMLEFAKNLITPFSLYNKIK